MQAEANERACVLATMVRDVVGVREVVGWAPTAPAHNILTDFTLGRQGANSLVRRGGPRAGRSRHHMQTCWTIRDPALY